MLVRQDIERGSSHAARVRLLDDQKLRPIAERRAALAILTRRLEQACRGQLLQSVSTRVRTDRRFVPVMGDLVRMALNS